MVKMNNMTQSAAFGNPLCFFLPRPDLMLLPGLKQITDVVPIQRAIKDITGLINEKVNRNSNKSFPTPVQKKRSSYLVSISGGKSLH